MDKHPIEIEKTVTTKAPTKEVLLDELSLRNPRYTEVTVLSSGVAAIKAVNGGIWYDDEKRSIVNSKWEILAEYDDGQGIIVERQP